MGILRVLPDAPVLPRALPQRPYGRPEGLRALAGFHALLAASLGLLPRISWQLAAEPLALTAQAQRALGVAAAAVCLLLSLAARLDAARIRSGMAAPGRRRRWALVTLGAAGLTLALLPLRGWAGQGRERGGPGEFFTYVLLAFGGATMLLLGWQELLRARRRGHGPGPGLAAVFHDAEAGGPGGAPGQAVAEEGTLARRYAARPREASGGGGGLLMPQALPSPGFHGFGSAPAAHHAEASQPAHAQRAHPERPGDPARRVPGLRWALVLVGAAALLVVLWRLLAPLLGRGGA